MIVTEGKTLSTVINELLKAIIEQGGPCRDNLGNCRYGLRDNPSVHCPVGWLLPADDEILMDFKGTVSRLIRSYPDRLGPNKDFILTHEDVLMLVQKLHDHPWAAGYSGKYYPYYKLSYIGVDRTLIDAWNELAHEQ